MSKHLEKITTALTAEGIKIDSTTASKVLNRLGETTVHDAPEGLLRFLARDAILAIAVEMVTAPKPQTREERARAWLEEHNLADGLGATKLRRWTHALNEIDKLDAAGTTHESRAIADVMAKDPNRVDAVDLLRIGHARDLDAGLKPSTNAAPVPTTALPSVDTHAPRDPLARLRSVNRLSGPLLTDYRQMSNLRATAATMPHGADRLAKERYADTLAHSLRQRGVAVP
jgi:hypothetical protein